MPDLIDSDSWADSWTEKRGVRHDLKCSILAAGLGRRMEPLTVRHLPKPLFPLGGKVPMVEVWVRRAVESGIGSISMNLCVLKETIKRHFREGAKLAASIEFVEEETPSGTLGGVCKQALGEAARSVVPGEAVTPFPAFSGSTLIVPSGDIVSNFGAGLLEEMYDIHKRQGAAFTMVLVPVPWERRKDYGTVVLDRAESLGGAISASGRVGEFREKDPDSPSNLNNASIYMIETELLRVLDPVRTAADREAAEPFYDFGQHVFPAMLGELPYVSLPSDFVLWGIQYEGAWFDVGQKRDYLRVNEHVLDGRLDVVLPYERLPWGHLGDDVAIDFSQVTIVPPVVIGNRCVVERGARLGPYAVLGDGWVVEEGAEVRNAVLWEDSAGVGGDGGETASGRPEPRVRAGVTIEESIVAAGAIGDDVKEMTVDRVEDGSVRSLPIDWIPSGPRA